MFMSVMFDILKSFYYVEVLIVTIVQKSRGYSKVVNNCMLFSLQMYFNILKYIALLVEQKLCYNASAVTRLFF